VIVGVYPLLLRIVWRLSGVCVFYAFAPADAFFYFKFKVKKEGRFITY
jgi:hypothetical protein